MEFLIAFIATVLIYSIFKSGKKTKKSFKAGDKQSSQTTEQKAKEDAEHQQKLKQADEELITVILPTMRNDK